MLNSSEEKQRVKYTYFDSNYDSTYLIPFLELRLSDEFTLMTGEACKKIDLDSQCFSQHAKEGGDKLHLLYADHLHNSIMLNCTRHLLSHHHS